MTTSKKRHKSIGKAEARATAEQVLAGLAVNGADGGAIGEELCGRYTPSSRLLILEEMAGKIRQGATILAPDSLRPFIDCLEDGVKTTEAPEHAVRMLDLAVAAYPEFDPPLSAELFFDLLARTEQEKKGRRRLVLGDDDLGLIRNLDRGAAVLVSTLQLAGSKQQIGLPFLRRWQRALLPLIGRKASQRKRLLSSDQAAQVLDVLGHLKIEDIPEELLLVCPRLVELAGSARTDFLDTAPGRALRDLLPTVTGSAPSSEILPPPRQEETELGPLRWETLLQRAVTQVQNQLRDQERLLTENQRQLHELREERDLAREAENKASERLKGLEDSFERTKVQLEQLEEEKKALDQKLHAIQEKADQWQAEARRRESELNAGFEDRERENLEKWRRLLVGPLRDLRGYVQDILEAHRGEKRVRQVGLVFDQLDRDLIQLLKLSGEPRLPREILAREPQPGSDQ